MNLRYGVVLVLLWSLMTSAIGQDKNFIITEDYNELINIKGLDEYDSEVNHSYIVAKRGSKYENLYFHYDDFINEIEDIEVVISSMDGSNEKKYKKKDFNDRSAISSYSIYENSRLKYLNISNSEYPYRVTVKSKQKYKSLAYLRGYFPTHKQHFVKNSTYSIKNANGIDIKHKISQPDCFNITEEPGGITKYTYVPKKIYLPEPNTPGIYSVIPYIVFSASQYELNNTTVDNRSWLTMGQYYYDLNIQEEGISTTLRQELHAITDSIRTDREKALVIHRKVVNELRYVSVQLGIGGWRAFSPQYVEERKYGDCKAMTCFLRACLDEVNIDSKMMLINSGYQDDLMDENFVFRGFNHAILYVPNLDLWLDPTREHALPGYLGLDLSDKWSLMLDNQNSKLVKSPDLSLNGNFHSSSIRVDDLLSSKLHVYRQYGGIYDHSYRIKRLRKTDSEQLHYVADKWSVDVSKVTNFKDTISTSEPQSTVSYALVKDGIFSKSGNRLFVPVLLKSQAIQSMQKNLKRQNDYYINMNSSSTLELGIKIPEDYSIEYLPESASVESQYGQYSIDFDQSNDYILIKRVYSKNKGVYKAEEYDDIYQFMEKVAALDKEEIVLVKK